MSEKLNWFKFSPADWMMGRIRKLPKEVQADFIALCCVYWNAECILNADDAELEIGEESLSKLLKYKIIKQNGDFVVINFLDYNMNGIQEESTSKSTSGKIGNLKRWHESIYNRFIAKELTLQEALRVAEQSHSDSTPIAEPSQSVAIKIREEEIREDKDKIRGEVADESASPLLNLSRTKLTQVNEDEIEGRTSREIFEVAKAFHYVIGENMKSLGSLTKAHENAKYKAWTDPVRLMIEQDKVTKEQLGVAFNYLKNTKDNFWKGNIQSTTSLRKHFTKVLTAASSKAKNESYKYEI